MSAKRVLLIGATGFTGQRVYHLLKNKAHVTCFVRKSSDVSSLGEDAQLAYGDLSDISSLKAAMKDADDIIYTASLGFGHGEGAVQAAEESGIQRAIFISTTGIFTKLNPSTKTLRLSAEKAIQSSKLSWSIIRPTMIYGRLGDRNMERLVKWLKKYPVFFMPGGGKALQQPVHVDDLAEGIIAAWENESSHQKIYTMSGKEAEPLVSIVKTIRCKLDKKIWLISLPVAPFVFLLRIYERLVYNPRLKAEQIQRLREDKDFDHDLAKEDLGYNPRAFTDGIDILIKELTS